MHGAARSILGQDNRRVRQDDGPGSLCLPHHMTIDEPLLAKVDRVFESLNTTRSAFNRQALQSALRRHRTAKLERRQASGYAPQARGV
jgi:hypothetical protein